MRPVRSGSPRWLVPKIVRCIAAATSTLLLLAAATSARGGEDAAKEPTNPVSRYAGVVELMWTVGSGLCKHAAGGETSACAEWFDANNSKTPKPQDDWDAAKAVVDRKPKAWDLLRDLRATYESCVQQATFPGATAVIVYRKQLAECDDRITRAVSLLKIEIE
jgi:hypothetical protein